MLDHIIKLVPSLVIIFKNCCVFIFPNRENRKEFKWRGS